MEPVLNTERMNKTTVGVVSYKTGDEIGFLFEPIVRNYPVNPLINVSKLPTQRHYIITFWIQILLFTAVLVFNILHLRKVYQYNIGKSTIKFKLSEKIKYTAIGLFVPIIGSIFYTMSGTNLYDEYKTIRGHYYIAGTAFTILLYILFTGWVFIL